MREREVLIAILDDLGTELQWPGVPLAVPGGDPTRWRLGWCCRRVPGMPHLSNFVCLLAHAPSRHDMARPDWIAMRGVAAWSR
jgi:hypothetical protein